MNESKLCWNCQDWMVSCRDTICGGCGANQPDPRIPLNNKIAELRADILKNQNKIKGIKDFSIDKNTHLWMTLIVCVMGLMKFFL